MNKITEWISRARLIVGPSYVLTNPDDLKPYSHDEFPLDAYTQTPLAVALPRTEEEISLLVKLCVELKTPLTVRGGGTGLSGGCAPLPDGIVLSMERLNRVLETDEINHTITVQAGTPLYTLYQAVDKMGLFFPPHPGDEGAFAGGVVATNAGGARAVKYGAIKRFVMGLGVVLASGEIIELGGKLYKSSAGYDLLHLMIGSEGTLGVITRVTFALRPLPGIMQTLIIPFQSIDNAIEAVPSILKAGIIPTAVEFVEHSVIRCAEQLLQKKWPAQIGTASLMVILDGKNDDDLMAQAELIVQIVEPGGSLDVYVAENKAQQDDILKMRSILYEALKPGVAEIFDITVPRSEIANHVRFVHELEHKLEIPLPTYGHAADGNTHTHFMRRALNDGVIGNELPNWQEKHEIVRNELFADAVKRGGVISGEHGIGVAKREHLKNTLGKTKINLMRQIKRVFDPHGVMNPGKIFAV